MKTILSNGAEYDSNLPFLDQSAECQQYFYYLMNNNIAVIDNDVHGRQITETWRDTETNLTIIRISEYHNDDPTDWSLIGQTIKIK